MLTRAYTGSASAAHSSLTDERLSQPPAAARTAWRPPPSMQSRPGVADTCNGSRLNRGMDGQLRMKRPPNPTKEGGGLTLNQRQRWRISREDDCQSRFGIYVFTLRPTKGEISRSEDPLKTNRPES